MHNMKLIQSEMFHHFMHTYADLELFKSVLSLNNQIFQLFQFIRAISRLLNHAKDLKFKDFIFMYVLSYVYKNF